MPYSVTLVEGVQASSHRGVCFLESGSDGDVNGKAVFDGLKAKLRNDVLSRFDYWLGGGKQDKYFHGWPGDRGYKWCFVFKWKEAGTYHRLYGFLFHLPTSSDPGFQVCVLVSHARKNSQNTDPSELEAVMRLRNKPEVIAAVKKAYAVHAKK
jgi:hypothetical protein